MEELEDNQGRLDKFSLYMDLVTEMTSGRLNLYEFEGDGTSAIILEELLKRRKGFFKLKKIKHYIGFNSNPEAIKEAKTIGLKRILIGKEEDHIAYLNKYKKGGKGILVMFNIPSEKEKEYKRRAEEKGLVVCSYPAI